MIDLTISNADAFCNRCTNNACQQITIVLLLLVTWEYMYVMHLCKDCIGASHTYIPKDYNHCTYTEVHLSPFIVLFVRFMMSRCEMFA